MSRFGRCGSNVPVFAALLVMLFCSCSAFRSGELKRQCVRLPYQAFTRVFKCHDGIRLASTTIIDPSGNSNDNNSNNNETENLDLILTEVELLAPIKATSTDIQSLESVPNNDNNNVPKARRKPTVVVHPPPPDKQEFPDWAYQSRDFFRYEILHESSRSQARVGRIHTPHGIIDTPGFVAVATNAALKGVDFRQADDANQQLIFSNTYHLMLHPGADIIAEAGGIHKWTNRLDRPFITDSGGFQVFSLAYGSVHEELTSKGELKRSAKGKSAEYMNRDVMGEDAVKVSEEGVMFRSYRDGTKFLLTPETTVQAQKKIGADIIIPLDELPGYFTDRSALVESVDRTHRWEGRSLQEHLKNVNNQAMYCVVHGGIDKELRTKSVNYLSSLPFDGFAIGGSLGNGKQEMQDLLSWMMPMFDEDSRKNKPRHLLGIADEWSIRHAVTKGIDTLDSCYPTRLGRHGTVLTRGGTIRLTSGSHKRSFGIKIDEKCNCTTCQHYDRAYLWHLFKANEPLAIPLATIHNIQYMNDLMAEIRSDIYNDLI
jgi:queuine tRNA-ribosyltransferase